MHPRSGLAARHGLSIVNTPGTIDAGYRGEVKVLLVNHDPREPIELRRGDRVAQLVFQRVERAAFIEVEDLPDSVRGTAATVLPEASGPPTRPATQGATHVKFRRKAAARRRRGRRHVDDPATTSSEAADAEDLLADGPFDSDELPAERRRAGRPRLAADHARARPRAAAPGRRGQRRRAVGGLAGPDGALELRAFAAPRNGDLWSEMRPQIAAEVAQARRHGHRARGAAGAPS